MAAVIVPLRSFSGGKARLATILDAAERVEFARAMANRIVDAAGARAVVIVSSAIEVIEWAAERGLARIDDPGTLDAAARDGRAWARAHGHDRFVVAHADLPLATTLDHVAGDAALPIAVIVPDHRGDGTPVLALPADAAFEFAYGPGSFARHVEEASRCGLETRIVHDHALSFDIDVPADLEALRAGAPQAARDAGLVR